MGESRSKDVVNFCYDLHRKYHPNIKYFVGGSNAGFCRQLKVAFDENPNYDPSDSNPQSQEIIPVSFGTEHKQMLSWLYLMINKGWLAFPDKYEKLIISLRTAQAKEYSLVKEETSYNDTLDALRLSLKGYTIQ